MTAVVYWRPTDAVSIRAVNILQNLQRAFPTFFSVVAVLAPKYPSERKFLEEDSTADNIDEKNIYDYLLIPSEKPENILLDAKLESWKELTIKNWPTVLICVNKKGENSKEGEKGKIMFALESQRSVSSMVGKALSAVLTVIQYEDEKKENNSINNNDGTESKVNLAGVGMWGKNFDALWSSTPILPPPVGSSGTKITTFSRPMRLSINNKNGMLYISDTGMHTFNLFEILVIGCIISQSSILDSLFFLFLFHFY